MRCEYAHDDGAYVLGALAPAERAAYERHLAGCPACREAVAELAVLPGLLGRLDPATAEQVAQVQERTEPAVLPRLIAAARADRVRQRRRARWRTGLAAMAAGVVALAVAVVVGTGGSGDSAGNGPAPVTLVAMSPVGGSGAVTAEVGITPATGGTRITVHCSYRSGGTWRRPYTFRLYAIALDGSAEQVASWAASPGDELHFDGLTRFDRAAIDRVELRRADGTPILVYSLR